MSPEADVLLIELREGVYANSEEVAPGMIVDFDEQGQPLRIEILNARDMLDLEGGFKLEVLPFILKQPA